LNPKIEIVVEKKFELLKNVALSPKIEVNVDKKI
jgi:hypothetical protein